MKVNNMVNIIYLPISYNTLLYTLILVDYHFQNEALNI